MRSLDLSDLDCFHYEGQGMALSNQFLIRIRICRLLSRGLERLDLSIRAVFDYYGYVKIYTIGIIAFSFVRIASRDARRWKIGTHTIRYC